MFREVVCGKVVGSCMDKGKKKEVKKYYFNKRGCIMCVFGYYLFC